MELSNLPRDLIEEILSKLSDTSLRAMRLTCKKLNTSFVQEKHISEEESMEIMLINDKIYLMDINFHGLYINRKAELISLNGLDQVMDISEIFHCDGLLLCVTKDENIVVWNSYTAETKWLELRDDYEDRLYDKYIIGYDKNSIHKVLRFSYNNSSCEVYDLKNESWRVLDITAPEWYRCEGNMSVKGNTYWIEGNKTQLLYLICFDFTNERFGPKLSLPFRYNAGDNVTLSNVREEQLVVLIQRPRRSSKMEIWVTSNIEPETVSWNHKLFLTVDMTPFITGHDLFLQTNFGGCFIDEEKKIAVVFAKNEDNTRHVAYSFGENGYIDQEDLGEVTDINNCEFFYVHIKKPKRKLILF